nr:hypothetical protein BaRGS_004988 [Batillaria attramentaria]
MQEQKWQLFTEDMSFNTSTPSKKPLTPSPDDSGVSIQLSELGEESEKMLGSTDTDSACKSNEVIMDMEDGKQEQIQFMVKFHNGIVAVIVITVKDSPKNLASLAGLAFFIIILFIFSSHPTRVLPVVVFFSCVITMLYHLGVMQAVISKIAFVMRCTLGTTAAESLCAAGNIFVGQTEAPILIRPFLSVMTKSELHAVMVGGQYRNILEAAAAGASQSIALVANIAANLIAFLALLAFVNATLAWFGAFVCLPNLSFESICHYLLMPVVYLMGVRWEDAGHVAELIALKTFLNEFVAYEKLSEFINARLTCDDSIHILSPRSEIIATYALCGFSNLSSIGIMLGGLGPMAPQRVGDMAQIVVSALFGGVVACLITASVAERLQCR